MPLTPTPRDVVSREGTAELYRFRPVARALAPVRPAKIAPVLLVPSLINRWYILDLRPGASLAGALVEAGLDVFCLDWGIPGDEDRHLEWDDVVARLARAVRRVRRETGAERVALVGYCLGGTLTAIAAALEPDTVSRLVNLAGPIDFSEGGMLAHMTDRRWFDADAIAGAGNVAPWQMQTAFIALRPTAQLAKWVGFLERANEPDKVEAFSLLEEWAAENIPFPAAAYRRYISELYQDNALVRGAHWVAGRRVELRAIACPLLSVVTDRDVICPPKAAFALEALVSSSEKRRLVIRGGHVGAVVGSSARRDLYPKIADFLGQSCAEENTWS